MVLWLASNAKNISNSTGFSQFLKSRGIGLGWWPSHSIYMDDWICWSPAVCQSNIPSQLYNYGILLCCLHCSLAMALKHFPWSILIHHQGDPSILSVLICDRYQCPRHIDTSDDRQAISSLQRGHCWTEWTWSSIVRTSTTMHHRPHHRFQHFHISNLEFIAKLPLLHFYRLHHGLVSRLSCKFLQSAKRAHNRDIDSQMIGILSQCLPSHFGGRISQPSRWNYCAGTSQHRCPQARSDRYLNCDANQFSGSKGNGWSVWI